MSLLDSYFTGVTKPELHPVVTKLVKMKNDGKEISIEIRRKENGIGFKPAEIFISINQGLPAIYQWDDELNEDLIGNGFKVTSEEDEKLRFSLTVQHRFQKYENRYGDSYFNAVFSERIRATPFMEYKSVSAVMAHVRESNPARDTTAYCDCRDAIDSVLQSCGTNLIKELRYPKEVAETILADALAIYIDERFNISSRRKLGWL